MSDESDDFGEADDQAELDALYYAWVRFVVALELTDLGVCMALIRAPMRYAWPGGPRLRDRSNGPS